MEQTDIYKIDPKSEYAHINPNRRYWTTDDSACEICGKRFTTPNMAFEMFDPDGDVQSIIGHKSCGTKRNLELV
jgi:hypothetical protein